MPRRWSSPGSWPGLLRGLALLAARETRSRLGLAPARPVVNPASPELRRLIDQHARRVAPVDGEAAARLFTEGMLAIWQTTLVRRPDGTIHVLTGDIPAMWLRDSAAQLRPFVLLADQSDEVSDAIAAVVARQWACIEVDPYANAFNPSPSGLSWHPGDQVSDPRVWERKYEVDSLAFPLQLAWQLWQVTGRTDHLPTVVAGAQTVLELWQREQQHPTRSIYRFTRCGGGSLPANGRGTPVVDTGMTWSGFRPSDDPCRYGYNIPQQLFAAHTLRLLAQMAAREDAAPNVAERAVTLADEIEAGVRRHGRVQVTGHGEVFAYEVDGLGSQVLMDDANMPSLLSLPLCSSLRPDDPMYLATRRFVLSEANPSFHRGVHASGIGSPHTPAGHVWPIALAVQALTTDDPEEQSRLTQSLVATAADGGVVHESFHPDDPRRHTRDWFAWATAMVCELLLVRSELSPDAPR
nr:glycoside hydrolase family 125 protein [Aestuariimicrobium ganziense]